MKRPEMSQRENLIEKHSKTKMLVLLDIIRKLNVENRNLFILVKKQQKIIHEYENNNTKSIH